MLTGLRTLLLLPVLIGSVVAAQSTDSEREELKIAALEALMSSPSERALPLVMRVLDGDGSDELKERALFVLSQIDHPDAHDRILTVARNGSPELREEAIRMIGIAGDKDTLAGLAEMYESGDEDIREAVLEAYLIADDTNAVYQIAVNAKDEDEFEEAVDILGAMGAVDELRQLRNKSGYSEALIDALAISDDFETLSEFARDDSDPERQLLAIEALGIVGGREVDAALVDIYRNATSDDIREAALDGMLIADHDDGVLALYRESDSMSEKRELLELLVTMDSDYALEVIDAALQGDQ